MNCKQANEIDIIQLLTDEGFTPIRIDGKNARFLRPNGNEKEASFFVSKNRFKDFGTNQKGGTLDLAMLLWNCSIKEALQKLENYKPNSIKYQLDMKVQDHKPGINIIEVKPLQSKVLYAYLYKRGIKPTIGKKFLKEIHFNWDGGKKQFALGWPTDKGTFELRNQIIKLSSGKDITTIINNSKDTNQVYIYEGFMDYLSHYQMRNGNFNADVLVLNSLVNTSKAIAFLSKFEQLCLNLDNDILGKQYVLKFKEIFPHKRIIDCSVDYTGYKDLNDFLNNIII